MSIAEFPSAAAATCRKRPPPDHEEIRRRWIMSLYQQDGQRRFPRTLQFHVCHGRHPSGPATPSKDREGSWINRVDRIDQLDDQVLTGLVAGGAVAVDHREHMAGA